MFDRIGTGRGHCHFCMEWGQVAVLYTIDESAAAAVEACEKCLRAAGKAAELLAVLRKAKAPAPKKVRNGRQSRATAPPLHPPKEAVSSLVPSTEDAP